MTAAPKPSRNRRSVLVVCDGMRDDLLSEKTTPNIMRFAGEGTRFANHRSMFPSLTRVCSASIATGCWPSAHGLYGNTVALDEGEGMITLNVGAPDFRDRMRRVYGRTLRRPTLSERLSDRGGVVVFSNVSPGAAYFQDPDGHGHVHNRAGSFGPGLVPLPDALKLDVEPTIEGDRLTTERFCREVLTNTGPAHATLWLCQPDKFGHLHGLGSPEHREAVRAADRCVGLVTDAIEAIDPRFEESLMLVGSDHGMETIRRLIPIERELVAAGLKDSIDSREVVVAPNGTAALIYLAPDAFSRLGALIEFFEAADWCRAAYSGKLLSEQGLGGDQCPEIVIDLQHYDRQNEHGIIGMCDAAADPLNDATGVGGAMHGGLGPHEQRPFLVGRGPGFPAGRISTDETRLIDLAPTILGFHQAGDDGADGRDLRVSL